MTAKSKDIVEWDSNLLGGSWKRQIVNPALEEERKKCTFDQKELARFVFTEPVYDLMQDMDQLLKKHPELAGE
jgi:hypothetical protein